MEYTTLGNTGLRVSKLGLGGAPLAGGFEPTDAKEVERMIHGAVDVGINFIDTAPLYGDGESERRIGQGLLGRRDRVVLASKAVRSDRTYDYRKTVQSVEESLRRLQTDWIDLMQIHDVAKQSWDLIVYETIPALQKLKQDGKIRFIGVTDKDLSLLLAYLRTGAFDTVQFYAKYMLADHSAKKELLPYTREQGIGVINGSVLGMGVLADSPASFLNEALKSKARAALEQLEFLRTKPGKGGLIEPGMRFSLSNPDIHVTLSGVSTVAALRMNAAFCDGKGLSPEDERRVLERFAGKTLF